MRRREGGLGILWALAACAMVATPGLRAEDKDTKPADKPADSASATPKEESSVTDHSITIGGRAIPYKATASTILLKGEKDEPTALIYSTAYTRSDQKDMSQRPIAFLYNGGPGSRKAIGRWLMSF